MNKGKLLLLLLLLIVIWVVISDDEIKDSSEIIDSVVENSNITKSTVINAIIKDSENISNSRVEQSNITKSRVEYSSLKDSKVENSDILDSIVQSSTIDESKLESSVADNLNMSGSRLANATVSNAVIFGNVIASGTNAEIELTKEGVTINFTNVYENASVDELITNTIVNDTSVQVEHIVVVVNDVATSNYSVTVDAKLEVRGKMASAETVINPGGKPLPDKVEGTKFLFIDAPSFNSSVMRVATVKMKHGRVNCDRFNVSIYRFNESDPGSDWIALTSSCIGRYAFANTTGFSVFGVAGSVYALDGTIIQYNLKNVTPAYSPSAPALTRAPPSPEGFSIPYKKK